jgi:cell division protease FtsH
MLRDAWVLSQQVKPLPYSGFIQELKAGNIEEIAVHPNIIEGTLRKPRQDGGKRFVTTRVETDLARDLAQYDGLRGRTACFSHAAASGAATAFLF